MPKKFARGGQDTRGAKAKAQKSAARAAKEARSAAQHEAAEAADWDRGSNKRKQAREQKLKAKEAARLQKQQAKREAEAQDAAEIAKMRISKGKARKAAKAKKGKLTAFQRQMLATRRKMKEAQAKAAAEAKANNSVVNTDPLLVKNQNQERGSGELVDASTLSEAVSVLDLASRAGAQQQPDRHPERRAKAAYKAFHEREYARMKAEEPSLRKTQLDQRIFKMWTKSPENPRNQMSVAYNSKPTGN